MIAKEASECSIQACSLKVEWTEKVLEMKALKTEKKKIVSSAGGLSNLSQHFDFPSVDNLCGDADFPFQQNLAFARIIRSTKTWFNNNSINVTHPWDGLTYTS